jgi:hypothetical protein
MPKDAETLELLNSAYSRVYHINSSYRAVFQPMFYTILASIYQICFSSYGGELLTEGRTIKVPGHGLFLQEIHGRHMGP